MKPQALSRREFLNRSALLAGSALLSPELLPAAEAGRKRTATDQVTLGKTGLKLSRLGFGAGSNSGNVQKALGQEVIKTLRPEQVMVKVVYDELVRLMGPIETRIPFVSAPPTIILMAGLQGSGKTTTCAKLARYCMQRGKKPLLTAADLKRPAAIDQLEVLGEQSVYLRWADGHETFFLVEELRALCRCARCVGEPEFPISGR